MTLKDELLRSIRAQYATGEEWKNSSRKKEEAQPKQKQHPVVDVTGDGSKIQCYKEQYCIETWNVRSMKVKVKSVVSNSCDPMDCSPPGSSIHGIFQQEY